MSTRFHFLYRIDMWSSDDAKVIEHLAGVEDFQVAMATYRAACERWPGRTITLSQGARVIESPIRTRHEARGDSLAFLRDSHGDLSLWASSWRTRPSRLPLARFLSAGASSPP